MCSTANVVDETDLNFNVKNKCVKKCPKEIRLLSKMGRTKINPVRSIQTSKFD
jgi:hypothetical protein